MISVLKRKIFGSALILLTILLVFVPFLYTQEVSLNPKGGFKKVLENGLTVLIKEMPASDVVSVYALVKAGSATEGKFLGTGISHFLEHMLFKGTTTRGVGEIAAQIQAVGGTINASTGMDYTIFTITVPSDSFLLALEILGDALMNSTMDAVEFEKEREVIFGELRMNNDNPDRKLNEITFQNVYLRHPYKHPIIGYDSLLGGLTRDDLLEYYHTYYMPNNMILSIAGNVQARKILPPIEQVFKEFKRDREKPRNLPQEPAQITQRRYEEEYPTDLTRLTINFQSTNLLHPDLYALDVLANILGQGRSSRFYEEIYKEKDLAHGISASNYTPMDQGVFQIDCVLEKENIEKVIRAVEEEIEIVQKKGVKPEELDKAKRQVLSDHILGQQTTSAVAYMQATDEAFTGDCEFSQKYVDAIKQVTGKDVKRVARKYLKQTALTIVVLKPKEEATQTQEAKLPARPEIQKVVLPNGLTILLREDHTFPSVSLRLVLNGGTREETPEFNGLSNLTALLWLKGTNTKSAEDIAQFTETLGMELGTFSGKNSLGLNIEFLAENIEEALDVSEDLIKNADFPQDELGKLKENVKAGIREKKDNIFQFTGQALKEELFLEHPLRLDEMGTLESVDRISRENIKNFYERLRVPSNMVISVFGDIHPGEVFKALQEKFDSIKGEEIILNAHKENPLVEPREKELSMDKEQTMVMFGFHGPSLASPDRYGVEILTSLLGSSFSGRLFTTIREELGQAYTLGGDFAPAPDMGFIYFYVLTTEENAEAVKKILSEEIRKLQEEDVSFEELRSVKTYLKGNLKIDQQTNASLGFTTGLDELYGLGWDNYLKFDQAVDQVTEKDIKRLAREYLDLKKAAIVVTRPSHP